MQLVEALSKSASGWAYRRRTDHVVIMQFLWEGATFIGTEAGEDVRFRKHWSKPGSYKDWESVPCDKYGAYRKAAFKLLGIPFTVSMTGWPVKEALSGADSGFAYHINANGLYLCHHSGLVYSLYAECFVEGTNCTPRLVENAQFKSWFPLLNCDLTPALTISGGRLAADVASRLGTPLDCSTPESNKGSGLRLLLKSINDRRKTIAKIAAEIENVSLDDLDSLWMKTKELVTEITALRDQL